MNIIHIAGFLGSDPEVRFTSGGLKVTTLRVASKVRKNKADDTIWWRVTVWGEQFDKMMTYLKKGSAVMVTGDLAKPEIFQDREGNPRISMSLTATSLMFSPFGKTDRSNEGFQGSDSSNQNSSNQNSSNQNSSNQNSSSTEEYAGFASGKAAETKIADDEIPF